MVLRKSIKQKKAERLEEMKKMSRGLKITYIILGVLVMFSLIRAVMLGNYENAFLCVLVLLMFSIPSFVKRQFHLDIPNVLEILVLIYIFAAEILGEIASFFVNISFWDTMLHTTWGFICAALGFSLIDVLNRDDKIKFTISPFYVSAASFCFSMTVGVFWEFFEFGMDRFFGKDMQKDTIINSFNSTLLDPTKSNIPIKVSGITDTAVNGTSLGINGYLDVGLYDTMEDLFVNFLGALVFCIIGYFYIKHRGKGKIAKNFIPTLRTDECEKTTENPVPEITENEEQKTIGT